MDVLDDLGDGRYMRTMVASSNDVSGSEYQLSIEMYLLVVYILYSDE